MLCVLLDINHASYSDVARQETNLTVWCRRSHDGLLILVCHFVIAFRQCSVMIIPPKVVIYVSLSLIITPCVDITVQNGHVSTCIRFEATSQ